PSSWDEEEVKAFHHDCEFDVSEIVMVKLLAPKRAGTNNRAAIVKYTSHVAAQKALQMVRGHGGGMEVRFAEEKSEKFANTGKGEGKSFQGAQGGHSYKEQVPVTGGLRVRNSGNGQAGRVVACRGRTPGTFRVLFDNGQEWEWEVKRFESEDGWPLLDAEAIPATINLRVRCWMDGRVGRIAYIHNDWPQRIWVMFDDGDEGEKDAAWFVSEDGCYPIGPGHTESDWKHSAPSGASKGSGPPADRYQNQ
ncbi:unnamed protein product, partial [Polarella glacialis]